MKYFALAALVATSQALVLREDPIVDTAKDVNHNLPETAMSGPDYMLNMAALSGKHHEEQQAKADAYEAKRVDAIKRHEENLEKLAAEDAAAEAATVAELKAQHEQAVKDAAKLKEEQDLAAAEAAKEHAVYIKDRHTAILAEAQAIKDEIKASNDAQLAKYASAKEAVGAKPEGYTADEWHVAALPGHHFE